MHYCAKKIKCDCSCVFNQDEEYLVCIVNFEQGEKFTVKIHTRCPECHRLPRVLNLPKTVEKRVLNLSDYYYTFAPCLYIKEFSDIKIREDKLRICGFNFDTKWWETYCGYCQKVHTVNSAVFGAAHQRQLQY